MIPSARLMPENDPSTLFTSSGMQPLVPYLLGQKHPEGTRLVNSQKSVRTGDIEEVGDNRHLTFFEMLGNWSLGDYFKNEEIPWLYDFLTVELGLGPERLWFTCFEGDESLGISKDEESFGLWRSRGIPAERIRFYPAHKNWWSRSGEPKDMPAGEIGGPDTEVFYDFGTPHDPAYGPACHQNCDCGRFVEICNAVFMEYRKKPDGSFEKLPQRNVDFGGGLERLAATTLGTADLYMVDTIVPLINELDALSQKNYTDPAHQKSFRIIADHVRAATFMLGDGVLPGNADQGYVARRLIRRAVRHLDKLGVGEGALSTLSEKVIRAYEAQYPELSAGRLAIHDALREEEGRFRKTLAAGMKEFEKGTDPFILFSTYGFPIELTEELAKEAGRTVDIEKFEKDMEGHQNLSRAGAAQKFAGGLADHAEQTIKYHTAHHILLTALQMVLGPEVHQRGSNITSERLRIDFSSPGKVTKDQIMEVEEIVNKKIAEAIPVIRTDMPKEKAEKLGAEHEFGTTYPDMVSVYSVGPLGSAFSIEFCGGPHVSNTAEIGEGNKKFKILKEEAVAAGIRRIKAVVV